MVEASGHAQTGKIYQEPIFSLPMKQSTPPDDLYLIDQIVQAQPEAVAKLYDRYNRLVFSVAFAVVGDRALAEEITLDVFMHVWRRAGTYRADRGKVSTWIVAITRNHAIDILRWYKAHPEADGLNWEDFGMQAEHGGHAIEDRLETSLEQQQVHQALAQLPVEQQQALMLAYFRGLSHQQIAQTLDQPLGTVKTRIRLAMQKLRKLLKEE